ncbi:transposase [Pseudoalteromonas sp. SR43-5]|uniref:transposase n=1 Tax=Pseudoalteromonas sp. SR43-5 TaxID=2760941 RepID=UPI0015F9CF22|nr:transposase [Pseudoalteromonas sp. SR43-5]MBB1305953.1 transposase [Pseudoalteromonas sp. SR43-5]
MRRRFTQEFKVQAVEKALSQCDDVRLEDIALELGIGYSTLQRWIALAKNHEFETKTAKLRWVSLLFKFLYIEYEKLKYF